MPEIKAPPVEPYKQPKSKPVSKTERILQQLREAGNKGVENYKLAEYNLGYRGRITELRQSGYNIYCEQQRINGKVTGTFIYYLTEED